MRTTRRNFIKTSGAAVASTALLSAMPLGLLSCGASRPKSFGFQVWTIRKELIDDFAGTLKKMAAMGYSEVEM
ncbi:MAG: twin-arginine translocation signal domain-containing protein [Bacteroidales bacterium]|nr:twin-arginine translocation signal domain-containing protein [Bacteroidales bacterium]